MAGKKGQIPWNKGKKLSLPYRKKLSDAKMGTKNNRWKGDKVSERAVHSWVEWNYGKPKTCEHCQKTNLSGRKINWANRDHKYKRDREDWMRLCVRCHCLHDMKTGLRDMTKNLNFRNKKHGTKN